jgi:hypothetical protein
MLGAFNAKVGREDIFKMTIENKSLHEISITMELDSHKKCHSQKY